MEFGRVPVFQIRHNEELFELLTGSSGDDLLHSGACVVQGLNFSSTVRAHRNFANWELSCRPQVLHLPPSWPSMRYKSLSVNEYRRRSDNVAKKIQLESPASVYRFQDRFWHEMENLDSTDAFCVAHPLPIPSKSVPEEGRDLFVLPMLLKEQKTGSRDLSFPLPSSMSFSQDVDSQLMFRSLFCYTPWRQNSVPTATYIHSGASMSCYICPESSIHELKAALDEEIFNPEILIKLGCQVNTVVLGVGDILILGPGSYAFTFSHGFQILERIGICFKPWLQRYLALSIPKTIPVEFIIHHSALQARKGLRNRARNPDPDEWISQSVLLAEQDLRDGLLKKLRTLSSAITQIHHPPELPFLLKEYFGKICGHCKGYMYFISIHPNSENDLASSETEILSQDFKGGGGICLDCALKRRPPKSGFSITVPKHLGFSVSKCGETSSVITQIKNGISSALKRSQKTASCSDFRFRRFDSSIAVPFPLLLPSSLHKLGEDRFSQFQWTEEDSCIHQRVLLLEQLLDLDIPPTLTSNTAFDLKLRQLQVSRAFDQALQASTVSSSSLAKTPVSWMEDFDEEMIESVTEQIQEVQQEEDGDQSSCASCHSCVPNEEQSCVEMLRRMESATFSSDSVRTVPVPTTEVYESNPVVVVIPAPMPAAKLDPPRPEKGSPKKGGRGMRVTDRRMVVGSLRRVLRGLGNSGQNANSSFLLATDVFKALMTDRDFHTRCLDIPKAVQTMFRSIRSFSRTFTTPIKLPTRPRLATVEGVEQVVLNYAEIHALYVTLYHYEQVIAQKLQSFVSGVWELSI